MHIGKPIEGSVTYSLDSTCLETITEEKDIGVIIDNDLEFDSHISEKAKKATQMFAMLRRSFHYLNDDLFLPLYKSLVRVHLDFASTVWSPCIRLNTSSNLKVSRGESPNNYLECRTYPMLKDSKD